MRVIAREHDLGRLGRRGDRGLAGRGLDEIGAAPRWRGGVAASISVGRGEFAGLQDHLEHAARRRPRAPPRPSRRRAPCRRAGTPRRAGRDRSRRRRRRAPRSTSSIDALDILAAGAGNSRPSRCAPASPSSARARRADELRPDADGGDRAVRRQRLAAQARRWRASRAAVGQIGEIEAAQGAPRQRAASDIVGVLPTKARMRRSKPAAAPAAVSLVSRVRGRGAARCRRPGWSRPRPPRP